ncbi:MAG: hypothetical protein LAO24_01605 [Acidobacteriia bacterium]|nr:hypothetical protein [Terriglobia bacterium]
MKSFGRYALVITGALLVGAVLFVLSFVAMDFVWTHFVTKPADVGLGDGVVVVGGGLIVGTTLGLLGLAIVLYRFWPSRLSKSPTIETVTHP